MKNKIKNFIKKIISVSIPEKIIIILLSIDPRNFRRKNQYFWRIILIKKNYLNLLENIRFLNSVKKIGIVIQGPIISQENYTYDTICFLKKYTKNSEIVLSTWETEDKNELEKIEGLGIKVIKNKLPKQGIENLNYQIISTRNGINYFLPNKEIKFIMKLRTDQRINIENFENKLISLINSFKLTDGKRVQKERIIGLDINTPKFIPYSFCDMFQFGIKEDLYLMWNVDLSLEKRSAEERKKKNPKIKDYFTYLDPEIYIYKNFLYKTGFDVKNTLESSLESLATKFLVIDSEMLGFHWFKYSSGKKLGEYSDRYCHQTLKFLDWLELYTNFKKIDFEKLNQIQEIVFEEKFY